jgi:hypothetical protein
MPTPDVASTTSSTAESADVSSATSFEADVANLFGDYSAPSDGGSPEPESTSAAGTTPAEPATGTDTETASDPAAAGDATTTAASDGTTPDTPPATGAADADPFADTTPATFMVNGVSVTNEDIRVFKEGGAVIRPEALPNVLSKLSERESLQDRNHRQSQEYQTFAKVVEWTDPSTNKTRTSTRRRTPTSRPRSSSSRGAEVVPLLPEGEHRRLGQREPRPADPDAADPAGVHPRRRQRADHEHPAPTHGTFMPVQMNAGTATPDWRRRSNRARGAMIEDQTTYQANMSGYSIGRGIGLSTYGTSVGTLAVVKTTGLGSAPRRSSRSRTRSARATFVRGQRRGRAGHVPLVLFRVNEPHRADPLGRDRGVRHRHRLAVRDVGRRLHRRHVHLEHHADRGRSDRLRRTRTATSRSPARTTTTGRSASRTILLSDSSKARPRPRATPKWAAGSTHRDASASRSS